MGICYERITRAIVCSWPQAVRSPCSAEWATNAATDEDGRVRKGGAMSKDIEDIGSSDDISGFGREADRADEVRTAPDLDPAEDLDELDVEAPRDDAVEQRESVTGD